MPFDVEIPGLGIQKFDTLEDADEFLADHQRTAAPAIPIDESGPTIGPEVGGPAATGALPEVDKFQLSAPSLRQVAPSLGALVDVIRDPSKAAANPTAGLMDVTGLSGLLRGLRAPADVIQSMQVEGPTEQLKRGEEIDPTVGPKRALRTLLGQTPAASEEELESATGVKGSYLQQILTDPLSYVGKVPGPAPLSPKAIASQALEARLPSGKPLIGAEREAVAARALEKRSGGLVLQGAEREEARQALGQLKAKVAALQGDTAGIDAALREASTAQSAAPGEVISTQIADLLQKKSTNQGLVGEALANIEGSKQILGSKRTGTGPITTELSKEVPGLTMGGYGPPEKIVPPAPRAVTFPNVNPEISQQINDILTNPNKKPLEMLQTDEASQNLGDNIAQAHLRRAALANAKDLSDFAKRNPGNFQKFINYFRQQFSDVPKRLGAEPHGGEINQQLFAANKYVGSNLESLDSITEEAFSKLDGLKPLQVRDITHQVKAASETGDLSKLKTPLAAEVYDAYQKRLSQMTSLMEEAGRATRKNYFTKQVDIAAGDPSALFQHRLPGDVISPYEKARVPHKGAEIADDIRSIVRRHDESMLHAIAYDPIVKYVKDLPDGTSPEAIKILKGIIFPERSEGGIFGWVTNRRFETKLKHNPFNATENLSQRHLADAAVQPEAKVLAHDLRKAQDQLGLKDFFTSNISSQAEAVTSNRLVPKGGLFPLSEKRNWATARADGLAQVIVQQPEYFELLKKGRTRLQAAQELLNKPAFSVAHGDYIPETVLERGKVYGEDLATKSQFIQSRGYRPELFEKAAATPFKVLTQFLRFDVSSAEAIKDLLTKTGRESAIMRRGFTDETTIVEALRARRMLRGGLRQAKTLGKVSPQTFDEIDKALQTEIHTLEIIAEKAQPSMKLHAVAELSKYFGKSFAAKFAKSLTGQGVKAALVATGLLAGGRKKKSLQQTALETAKNTVPGLGTAQFIGSLATGKTGDYPRQTAISDLLSILPIVGEVEGTVPGRPLSAIINEQLKKLK